MPSPSTFGLGTKPVFIQVDDDETITLYPRGGSLYYGDKTVTSATGTEVTDGASTTLTNDVWIVATHFIRVNAIRGARTVGASDGGGDVVPAAPVARSDDLGVWGETATVSLTDAYEIHTAELTASTLTELTVDGLAGERRCTLQVYQPSVTGAGTLTINGQAAAVAAAVDSLTIIEVFSTADGTQANFVVTNAELAAQSIKTNGTPMPGRGGVSFGEGFELIDDSANNQTVVNVTAVTAGSASVGPTSLIPMDDTGITDDAAETFGGTGIYAGRTRIQIPFRESVIARFHTPASLSPASPAGITACADPDHFDGAITMTTSGFTGRFAGQVLASATDISNKIVRVPCKITTTDKAQLLRCNMHVTSAIGGLDYTNYKQVQIQPQSKTYQAFDVWSNAAFGPAEWTDVGSGADLSAITGVRFEVDSNASGDTHSLSLSHVEILPVTGNANGRASLVICFDDWSDEHWEDRLPLFDSYGFRFTLVPNIAMATGTEVRGRIEHMQDRYGIQIMSHAYTGTEHNQGASGDTLRQQHARNRARYQALGIFGGEDWAWYGNFLPANQSNLEILRTYYRTGRLFESGPKRTETLPPMNPMRLMGYGMNGADQTDVGANMIAYIQKAIDQKGLAVITWHNVATAELNAVLDFAATKVASSELDVQTMEEALRPWIVER